MAARDVSVLATNPRHHPGTTRAALDGTYDKDAPHG